MIFIGVINLQTDTYSSMYNYSLNISEMNGFHIITHAIIKILVLDSVMNIE